MTTNSWTKTKEDSSEVDVAHGKSSSSEQSRYSERRYTMRIPLNLSFERKLFTEANDFDVICALHDLEYKVMKIYESCKGNPGCTYRGLVLAALESQFGTTCDDLTWEALNESQMSALSFDENGQPVDFAPAVKSVGTVQMGDDLVVPERSEHNG